MTTRGSPKPASPGSNMVTVADPIHWCQVPSVSVTLVPPPPAPAQRRGGFGVAGRQVLTLRGKPSSPQSKPGSPKSPDDLGSSQLPPATPSSQMGMLAPAATPISKPGTARTKGSTDGGLSVAGESAARRSKSAMEVYESMSTGRDAVRYHMPDSGGRRGKKAALFDDPAERALLRATTPPAFMPRSRSKKAQGTALDYAMDVERRLRQDLSEAREALAHERDKNVTLAKQLRAVQGGARGRGASGSPRRGGGGAGGSIMPHLSGGGTHSVSFASTVEEEVSEEDDDGTMEQTTGVGGLTSLRVRANTAAPSIGGSERGAGAASERGGYAHSHAPSLTPSGRLEARGRRHRAPGREHMTLAEISRSLGKHCPRLLSDCNEHIETSMRRLEEAARAKGLDPSDEGDDMGGTAWTFASKARLKVFEVCLDALINSFRVYGPLLGTIKNEYERAIKALDFALQDAVASKVNPAAEQQERAEAIIRESKLRVRELEDKLHERQKLIGEYQKRLSDAEHEKEDMEKRFKAAIVDRRRSALELAENRLFDNDKVLKERQALTSSVKKGQVALKLRIMQLEEELKRVKGHAMELEEQVEKLQEELQEVREERDKHKLHADTYVNKYDTLDHYYGREAAKKKQELNIAKARESAFKLFAERPRREHSKAVDEREHDNTPKPLSIDPAQAGRGSIHEGGGGVGLMGSLQAVTPTSRRKSSAFPTKGLDTDRRRSSAVPAKGLETRQL